MLFFTQIQELWCQDDEQSRIPKHDQRCRFAADAHGTMLGRASIDVEA
jgi:hypothetical protein